MKTVSTLSMQRKLLVMHVNEFLNALALVDSPVQVITPQDYLRRNLKIGESGDKETVVVFQNVSEKARN